MTRVMYQNVNNFGYNRFFTNSRARPPDIGGNTEARAAEDRLNVLTGVVSAANPDLFSIVEVVPGMAGIAAGCLNLDASAANLMDRLNLLGLQRPLGTLRNYRLVPPIVTGTGARAESVAVFYDMNRLQFLGPWAWPGGQGPANTAANIGVGLLRGYPPNWTVAANPLLNVLPNRLIPAASPYNANQLENTLAGQWSFENPALTRLHFPAGEFRRPFLTIFAELHAPNRIIKLLSFHAPPNQNPPGAPSVMGTAQLARVIEVSGPLAANEVACIVGDFNVSLFDDGGANAANQAYGPLMAAAPFGPGFTQEISRGAVPLADAFPGKSYVITHIRAAALATPWDPNGYPGFGYVSVPEIFWRYDAIDNVFTRYGWMAGGPAANATILNPVTGSPYNAAPPPAGAPPGSIVVASGMFNLAALPVPAGVPLNTPGRLRSFQAWDNYRKVHSTSDHMALALDL